MNKYVGVSVACLCAALATQGIAQSVTMTLAHQYPATQPIGDGYNLWAARVEELSGGDMKVTVFPGSTLIASDESFSAVTDGAVDASNMIGGFQTGDIPELAVLSMPFLFDDYEHYRRVVDNGLFDIVHDLYEAEGIKLLNLFPKGWNQIFHNAKFLLEPADFQGAQLRGPGGTASLALTTLGANEVRLPTTEVMASLQRGVVEGISTNCVAHVGRSWYEQAGYASIISMANDGEGLDLNLNTWNSLTPEQQAIVQQAADEMNDFEWEMQARVEGTECFENWERLGVQVAVATPEQRDALRAQMTPLFAQYEQELPLSVTVRALVEEHR